MTMSNTTSTGATWGLRCDTVTADAGGAGGGGREFLYLRRMRAARGKLIRVVVVDWIAQVAWLIGVRECDVRETRATGFDVALCTSHACDGVAMMTSGFFLITCTCFTKSGVVPPSTVA